MKRPAFQFYPADWSGSRWVPVDLTFVCYTPDLPCCYAVYLDGRLRYIGQTTSLRKRLRGHKIDTARYSDGYRTAWGFFDKVAVKARFATKFGDWAMREMRLIRRLQPDLNCVGSTRKRGPQ